MELLHSFTVDKLEAAYSAWDPETDHLLKLPIALPMPLPFCVEGPLLQFITSMSRRLDSHFAAQFIGLDKTNPNYEQEVRKALGNPHFLGAWIMAAKLKDQMGDPINKADSRAFSSYLDAMDNFDFQHTHDSAQDRANLVCVQNARREFIQALYHEVDGNPIVRPYAQVRLVVQDILSQLSPTWTGKQLREVSEPLAQLVKELIENSDWWARTDETGEPYRKGMRVLSFRLINIDDDNAEIFAGSNIHLHNYLQNVLLDNGKPRSEQPSSRERPTKQSAFVELSVVDSGPGLARRWLASREQERKIVKDLTDIPLSQEQAAIADCFRKWATSSHNSHRGIGLFSVARMLRQKNGFMRLRTGRLAYLFGTKSAIKDVESKLRNKPRLGGAEYELLRDGTHVFLEDKEMVYFLRPWNDDELRAVEGTSYSILLPV